MAIYSALCIIFFAIGLISFVNQPRSFRVFVYCLALFPTSFAFGSMVVRGNFFYFESFFIACALAFILNQLRISLPDRKSYILFASGVLFLFLSAVYSAIFTDYFESISSFIDFRLILLFFEITILYSLSVRGVGFSFDELTKVAIVGAISCLVWWTFNYMGAMTYGDQYYDEGNRYRYKQVGTDLAAIYPILLIYVSGKLGFKFKKIHAIGVVLSLLALAASGSRMLIFCTIASMLLAIKGPRQRLFFFAALVLCIPLIALISSETFSTGGAGAFALNGAASDFDMRLTPAQDYLRDIGVAELLFGNGFGAYFTIPWFEYRNLRPDLGIVDSIHVSMFVKFGCVYLFLLFTYLYVILKNLPARLKICLSLYFITMGFTVAFFYRPGFILVSAGLIAYGISLKITGSGHNGAVKLVR